MDLKYIIFVIYIGATFAQTEISTKDILNKLPPEFEGKVEEVTALRNKSVQAFKKKCEENGALDAYVASEKALTRLADCLKELVNPDEIKMEIENAKPNGRVDEVFKKYCDKKPMFKACFRNMTETVKPCFSAEEQHHLNTLHSITEQMAEFVCFKDGDRIALFIAENGPECIQEKNQDIQTCFNNTMGNMESYYDRNMDVFKNIPEIKFGENECNKLTELQKCIVGTLENCDRPTSANLVDSLFKHARKLTPCKPLPDPTEKPNSATSLVKSLAIGAFGLAVAAVI